MIRRACAAAILALFPAGLALGAPLGIVPFIEFYQGVNSNPGTIPDETLSAAKPRPDTFTQVMPGAGLGLWNGPVFKAGFRYQAEWERYDRVREGDSVSHLATLRLRWGGAAASVLTTVGYSYRAYPHVLGGDSLPVLNHDAGRVGLEVTVPFQSGGGLNAFIEGSGEMRRYPDYRVVTDGMRPDVLSSRQDRGMWGAVGFGWGWGDTAGWRIGAEAGMNDGNALANQGGEWADFFSYRAIGARVSAFRVFQGWPVRLEAMGRFQRRASAERVAGDGSDLEASSFYGVVGSATWALGRGIGLTAEIGVTANASNDPQTSFHETRFALGIRLLDLLFGEEAIPVARQAEVPQLADSEVNRLYDEARSTYDRGSYARSASLAEDLLRLVPGYWQGWWLLGNSLYANGDSIEAFDAYERSLDLNPGNQELRDWLSGVRAASVQPASK